MPGNTATLTALQFWAITGKPGNSASTACARAIFVALSSSWGRASNDKTSLAQAHLFFCTYYIFTEAVRFAQNGREREADLQRYDKTKSSDWSPNTIEYERIDRAIAEKESSIVDRVTNSDIGCLAETSSAAPWIKHVAVRWEKQEAIGGKAGSIHEWRVREKDRKWSKSQTRSSPRKSESINHRYVQ